MKKQALGVLILAVLLAVPAFAQMGGMWGGGSGGMMHHGGGDSGGMMHHGDGDHQGKASQHSEMSGKSMMNDKHMMYMMREWGGMMGNMSQMMRQGCTPEQMKEMSKMMRQMADEMDRMSKMMEGKASPQEMQKLHQSMMEMRNKINNMSQQN